MFGNWLKRRNQLAAVQNATADIERFILSLKGMSDEELGTVVALAAIMRMELRQIDELPDEALGVGLPLPEAREVAIRRAMVQTALAMQKQNNPMAGSAMVWVHTLRAFHFPEVRLLGRQMWAELQRGFSHALTAFGFIEGIAKQPPPLGSYQASQFIPVGLEPVER